MARALEREARLAPIQARAYVEIATSGAMGARALASRLGIGEREALGAATDLVRLGGLIEYDGDRFESPHPRFAAVNMYRRACAREGRKPARNDTIDSVGAALEEPFERARAKYPRGQGGA